MTEINICKSEDHKGNLICQEVQEDRNKDLRWGTFKTNINLRKRKRIKGMKVVMEEEKDKDM